MTAAKVPTTLSQKVGVHVDAVSVSDKSLHPVMVMLFGPSTTARMPVLLLVAFHIAAMNSAVGGDVARIFRGAWPLKLNS